MRPRDNKRRIIKSFIEKIKINLAFKSKNKI